MSKCIEKSQLGFNPKTTKDETIKKIFKCPVARTLWCCIRANHITDQYFNDRILEASKTYWELKESEKSNTHFSHYFDFMKAVNGLSHTYGIIFVKDGYHEWSIPDSEYWVSVWKHIGFFEEGIKYEVVKQNRGAWQLKF